MLRGCVLVVAVVRGGVAQTLRPGAVRPIDYEIVAKTQLARVGAVRAAVANHLHGMHELALLRCVDHRGDKLTVFGDPQQLRRLLRSGEAADPEGMMLSKDSFPVMVRGWIGAHDGRVADLPDDAAEVALADVPVGS
jgi:hypothetical protein